MNKQHFEHTDKRRRIALLYQAAHECEKAGFPNLAGVNREMADILHREVNPPPARGRVRK